MLIGQNIAKIIAPKADKVSSATSGHLASLDSTGNLADSGHSSSSFDAAGSASTVQSNLTTHTSNASNPHSTTAAQVGLGSVANAAQLTIANNLSDLSNITIARTNLGLGSAATQSTTAFDAAGAASAVQANLTSSKPTTFTNATTRAAATPSFIGQVGVQMSDGSLWVGTATTVGAWSVIPYISTGLFNQPNGVPQLDSSGNMVGPIQVYNGLSTNNTFMTSIPRAGQPFYVSDWCTFGVGDGATSLSNMSYAVSSQGGGAIGNPSSGLSPGILIIGGVLGFSTYANGSLVPGFVGAPVLAGSPQPAYIIMDYNGFDMGSAPIQFNTGDSQQYQIMADGYQNGLRISNIDSCLPFQANITNGSAVLKNVSVDISGWASYIGFKVNGFDTTQNPIVSFNSTTPGAIDNTVTLTNTIGVGSGAIRNFAIVNAGGQCTLLVDSIRHNNYGNLTQSTTPVGFGTGGVTTGRLCLSQSTISGSTGTFTPTGLASVYKLGTLTAGASYTIGLLPKNVTRWYESF